MKTLLILILSFILFASLTISTPVPVYVMMPLNLFKNDGTFTNYEKTKSSLMKLKSINTDGIMVDVWWGIVQRDGPTSYDWSGYKQFISLCLELKLKVQVVLSFHQCGANVGDQCFIPLPTWVTDVATKENNWDIFYTDKSGWRNQEYLTLGVDNEKLFKGVGDNKRSALELYNDFMINFKKEFESYLGSTITAIEVGLGPAGELRYPSYPLQEGKWEFPGVGEFITYDKYLKNSLKKAAEKIGKPEWGNAGPSNAGSYQSQPPFNIAFFTEWGNNNWDSQYGKFFLSWYSNQLIDHGSRVLNATNNVFYGSGVTIAGKIAGIHWWYKTNSHAAELTAGYYSTKYRNGYYYIANMFKKYNAELAFTCFEMKDSEQQNCECGPSELVKLVRDTSFKLGIKFSAENALPRYDETAYNQIISQAKSGDKTINGFTYLRLNKDLLKDDNFALFKNFIDKCHSL